jgi:hypothetical protein
VRDDAEFLAELAVRGAPGVAQVRFRNNRSRLLSLSAGGRRLNAHRCFRSAPPRVLDAIAAFVAARPGTPPHRRAVEVVRSWEGARSGIAAARAAGHAAAPGTAERQPATRRCAGTAAQRAQVAELYDRFNASHFGGRLPLLPASLPLRLSGRMARRYGQVHCQRLPDGTRRAGELALNVDLLLPGNEHQLRDTLLHEMAHVEAWLQHGHRGHGPAWRAVARRVGCEPRACTRARIAQRRR